MNSMGWQMTETGLSSIALTEEEYKYLKTNCPFLNAEYLDYLKGFRFRPEEHVSLTFDDEQNSQDSRGGLICNVRGMWLETILYEIPLLALTSEAYFRFIDTDWDYEGQEESAHQKGRDLLDYKIAFSEFGTRRRRSYQAQDLVLQGLSRAARDVHQGRFVGSSNVHFAMKYGVMPVGTVAHEWFMGTAASMDNYMDSTEKALQRWVRTFGDGVLGIALTDTFGTPAFLEAFARPMPFGDKTYAQSFAGVRQDSGDPEEFINIMRSFYDKHGIGKKTIIFSDSLNVEKSKKYHDMAIEKGFYPSFGIGTFFTSESGILVRVLVLMVKLDDFHHKSNREKSKPLNIVIKLSSANGNYAVKLSDESGKNTGDAATVRRAKEAFDYKDKHWDEADEAARW